MRRVLPHPVLTLSLTIFWLILQQDVSLGQVLLGAAVGLFAGIATSNLGLERPILRKPWVVVSLVFVVLVDVIRSNFAVAWIVATQGTAPKSAGFLRVPLKLRDQTYLAFLAIILTATPGTVWLEFDEDSGELLLHVLDLVDRESWIDTITNRYERRLLEISQ
ncbi:Na+/H+ antiporter subunit E [Pelagibacterium sp. 26DY04]|uniref:Na+/H+ antiporter subunit E n=1 Tax=Pelagibacterium sp. 26DY04 TaxID=2967130 RepID=UPI002814BDAC|nr:Na+/H+ antiporter subunit E [Pelagibacterium sp. 26DY04]WMT86822.1 Na+/H+ antiporter subunit E [Pelagibacterium sp. 26DY04]